MIMFAEDYIKLFYLETIDQIGYKMARTTLIEQIG